MSEETTFYKGLSIHHGEYPNIKVLNDTAGTDGSYPFCGEDKPMFVSRSMV